jgi:hypothetical protein
MRAVGKKTHIPALLCMLEPLMQMAHIALWYNHDLHWDWGGPAGMAVAAIAPRLLPIPTAPCTEPLRTAASAGGAPAFPPAFTPADHPYDVQRHMRIASASVSPSLVAEPPSDFRGRSELLDPPAHTPSSTPLLAFPCRHRCPLSPLPWPIDQPMSRFIACEPPHEKGCQPLG